MSFPERSARVSRRHLSRSLSAGIAAIAAGCSPVRILNGLAPARLAARDVPYGPAHRQRLDVYAPAGEMGGAPVLVFLYGGGWDSGSKEMYRFVGGAYAAAGYVVVIPDYRLYPEVVYPTFLSDCAASCAWAKEHAGTYGGDSARGLCLMGHSAGAYNAAMLALDPDYLARAGLSSTRDLRRVVGLAGPYDFLPLQSDELRTIFGPPAGRPATQPINHVDGRAAPMLLASGAKDMTVKPGNTIRLAARIREAGGIVEERIYPGLGHREVCGAIAAPLRFLAPVLRDTLVFMNS